MRFRTTVILIGVMAAVTPGCAQVLPGWYSSHVIDITRNGNDCTVFPIGDTPVCSETEGGPAGYCAERNGKAFTWVAKEPFSINFGPSGSGGPVKRCGSSYPKSRKTGEKEHELTCKTNTADYGKGKYEYRVQLRGDNTTTTCSINPHIIVRD